MINTKYFYFALFLTIGCNNTIHNNIESNSIENDSVFELGLQLLYEDSDNPNIDSALHYLELASKSNHPIATFVLGTEYLLGNRLTRNKILGIEYLNKAIALGESNAYISLAQFYYPDSINKSIDFLQSAFAANNKQAAFILAQLYMDGYAFGQIENKKTSIIDTPKGLEFLKKAAELGSFEAQLSLTYIYINGIEGIILPNKELARFFLKKASENPDALEILGALDELELAKSELDLN
jgi:TPR repeat protein